VVGSFDFKLQSLVEAVRHSHGVFWLAQIFSICAW